MIIYIGWFVKTRDHRLSGIREHFGDRALAEVQAVAAAARSPRALDRLVRSAFQHWLRAYAESAVAARLITAGAARNALDCALWDLAVASSVPTSPST